jgi:hypothetical protein
LHAKALKKMKRNKGCAVKTISPVKKAVHQMNKNSCVFYVWAVTKTAFPLRNRYNV